MNAPTTTTSRPAPPIEAGHQSMRAIVQTVYGSADVLHVAEVDRPTIEAGEVLIRVHAAGLDRGTWHLMAGEPYLIRIIGFGFRGPKNPGPGLDVAGTVVAAGATVTRFKVCDEVFGISRGSFADYASAREDQLVRKPAHLAFEQAAAIGVSGCTALQALRDAGRVEAGQRVLIIGASGGDGTFAVQLAKAFGAAVTAVSSAGKVDLVRSIGADHVLDYTRDDFADGSRRYDLILDIGGNSSLSRLRRALTHRGTLVIVGGEGGGRWTGMSRQLRALALSPFVPQRLTTFVSKPNAADLEHLAQLAEAGHLTPAIERTYPLDQAPDAMRHLEAGQARGKLVITLRIARFGAFGAKSTE